MKVTSLYKQIKKNRLSAADVFEKGSKRLVQILRQSVPKIVEKKVAFNAPKLSHVSAFTYGNAGDAILPPTIRNLVENDLSNAYKWNSVHAYKTVDNSILQSINSSNGLIIGGGGLFLKDTNPNNLSGWQWSCSIDMLKKIKVPIAVVAVGYNRFRNQPDFEPIFHEHVNLLAEKASFIGLRNSGSIENMKRYFRPEYHHKIAFQPCPTTILSHLYPALTQKDPSEKPFIAFNCAFDRSQLRFGEKIGEKLSAIARVAKALSKDYAIHYYSHAPSDNYFLPFFDAFGVKYKLVTLNTHPANIIQKYATPKLVIGMRGHAQMIPFGCQTPILSVISHEKMKWFTEDIAHPEWGVEMNSEDFEEKLLAGANHILGNEMSIAKELSDAQQKIVDISVNNMNFIEKAFKLK